MNAAYFLDPTVKTIWKHLREHHEGISPLECSQCAHSWYNQDT
jgi:hypothetical protein